MNNSIKKGIAVAVILLFIGLAFAPSINANISETNAIKINSKSHEILSNSVNGKIQIKNMIIFHFDFFTQQV